MKQDRDAVQYALALSQKIDPPDVCVFAETTTNQQTIRSPITIYGISGFSGQPAKIVIYPERPGYGIKFHIAGKSVRIPASPEFLQSTCKIGGRTVRATALQVPTGEFVYQIEHLMAAFFGLGIDNALVLLDSNGEIPMIDGSARTFCDAIIRVGIEIQSQPRTVIRITKPITIHNESDQTEIRVEPRVDNELCISHTIEYPSPIGLQSYEYMHGTKSFLLNLASARTFQPYPYPGFDQTAKYYRGFNFNESLRDSNLIVYSQEKYLVDQRFSDEPVRHKLLDFLGDIYLCGYQIVGTSIHLLRTGHRDNAQLAQRIWHTLRKDALGEH